MILVCILGLIQVVVVFRIFTVSPKLLLLPLIFLLILLLLLAPLLLLNRYALVLLLVAPAWILGAALALASARVCAIESHRSLSACKMARILTALMILLLLLLHVLLRRCVSRKLVAALVVHHEHTTAMGWTRLFCFSHLIFLLLLILMMHLVVLHPVLIDTLRAGLWGTLITRSCHRITFILHLHVEHASLPVPFDRRPANPLQATRLSDCMLGVRSSQTARICSALGGCHGGSCWIILQ